MDLEIDRQDLHRTHLRDDEAPSLDDEWVRVTVERFALSANNVTYAVFGDALRYWSVFPAPEGDDGTSWGRIPVWGFARVIESRHPDVAVGRRLFGYLPMSTELTMLPGRFDDRGFSDTAPHRAQLAGAYNRYGYVDVDPIHRDHREPHQMLLYPLFFTSFLVDDFFVDNADFGAEQQWISSASSKTAIGVAHLAHQRGVPTVVGVTSERNRSFVEDLGVYDRVVVYEAIRDVEPAPAVFVDVAGNADVTRDVHTHLDARLAHSMRVGGTHWDHQAPPGAALPGPTPAFFFAPGQITKRNRDWGRDELEARLGKAWDGYADWVDGWIAFTDHVGAAAVEAAYLGLLDNADDPRLGHLCTLIDDTEGT